MFNDKTAIFRHVTFSLLFAFSLCPAIANANQAEGKSKRPNILFMFTDDHALQAISAYGGRFKDIAPTPNLDRLASSGMLFNHCLVTNSICAPSRAVVLTGKYSHLNGQRTNKDRFDGSQQTAPKLLQKSGYQTAIVGKWHLKSTPTGFDHFEVLKGQGQYYNPLLLTNGKTIKHTGYTTDIITDQAIKWLDKRDKTKPFYLMCQHKAPHGRWEPAIRHLELFDGMDLPEPETLFDDYKGRGPAAAKHDMGIANDMGPSRLMFRYSSKHTKEQKAAFDAFYGPRNKAHHELLNAGKLTDIQKTKWNYQRYIKNYLRCVKAVDENVGRMLQYLDDNDLTDNTVVFYSSDQGFWLGEHGWFDKRWMYEETLHTPLMIRWPGLTKPGSINNDLVSNIDFAETFLSIAGADIPADMQGHTLKPVLSGNTPADWRKTHYYHYYETGGHGVALHYGVTDGTYKLIRFPEKNVDSWEFFDLNRDPMEMKSEYANPEYSGKVKDLKQELDRLREKYEVKD